MPKTNWSEIVEKLRQQEKLFRPFKGRDTGLVAEYPYIVLALAEAEKMAARCNGQQGAANHPENTGNAVTAPHIHSKFEEFPDAKS